MVDAPGSFLMGYGNLSEFVAELEDDGALVRVSAEVDPQFELAAITHQVQRSSDTPPALLFENVRGSTFPVATNLLGSRNRICKALGVASLEAAADRVCALVQPGAPHNWVETLKLLPRLAQLATLAPKTLSSGACQQVVKLGRDVNLETLPIPKCWPRDAAPAITSGQVITQHPESKARDVDLRPLLVRDRNTLLVDWDPHDDGWKNFEAYRAGQLQMPVAIALGGDPACTYAASAPLPVGADEYMLAGFLRDQNVELVRCRSVELDVPADAEFIIEGYIDTAEELVEAGPLGSSTGFYRIAAQLPELHVTALTHRANPLFPVIVPDSPPCEAAWLHRATEALFTPLLKLFLPELVDLHQPAYGAFRNFVFASIDKRYPQQAHKVMHALWSFSWLTFTKFIVIVDRYVNVRDEQAVWFQVGAHVHPGRDVVFCDGPTRMSDHAAPVAGLGRKLGLDATRKSAAEGHPRAWPEALALTPELADQVARRWSEYGLGNEGGVTNQESGR